MGSEMCIRDRPTSLPENNEEKLSTPVPASTNIFNEIANESKIPLKNNTIEQSIPTELPVNQENQIINTIPQEIKQELPVTVKPISKPQKPMFKGPRIPTRKIHSRMGKNRRAPKKPIKILKKPTVPKKPTSTQGNMGI